MNPPNSSRLTLEPRLIYAWTMYPGYGDGPYRSPILVHEVEPIGERRFDLSFMNIFYAAGVQNAVYRLRTLRREEKFIIAEQLIDGLKTDRVVIIEPMTRAWLRDYARTSEPLMDCLIRDYFRGSKAEPGGFPETGLEWLDHVWFALCVSLLKIGPPEVQLALACLVTASIKTAFGYGAFSAPPNDDHGAAARAIDAIADEDGSVIGCRSMQRRCIVWTRSFNAKRLE